MNVRNFLIVVVLGFISGFIFAQEDISVGNKKPKCFEKADAQKNKKFVDWECGKIAGIVDCNEKLEFDEGSNTIFSASSGSPYTGRCETCHQNGILERRITFMNGKEDGADTTYYQTGCLMVMRNHILGIENGKWLFFYDSTNYVAWEMNYLLGQKHGRQLFFSPRGDTTLEENYNNGVLNGVKKTYFRDAKLEKEVHYRKGIIDGPFLVYNKEGKLIQSSNYKEGKKNGVFTYNYDDGTLLRTENWIYDIKSGEFKTFYYQGAIQKIENYKRGLKEGWFEDRDSDQIVRRRALYKKDVMIEEHLFDDEGKEISTFGGAAKKGAEDDAMPADSKKKKTKKEKK
jgi:antitoxin component YwqK of YwqJK toxin-antitoxin module